MLKYTILPVDGFHMLSSHSIELLIDSITDNSPLQWNGNSNFLHILSRSSQKKKKRQTEKVLSQNSSNDSLDNFDERKPTIELEYSSSQDSSTNNSKLPDSPIVGNYGSSDEDRIVDLMKRTAFSSQGPGFESKYRTYENLSLLP